MKKIIFTTFAIALSAPLLFTSCSVSSGVERSVLDKTRLEESTRLAEREAKRKQEQLYLKQLQNYAELYVRQGSNKTGLRLAEDISKNDWEGLSAVPDMENLEVVSSQEYATTTVRISWSKKNKDFSISGRIYIYDLMSKSPSCTFKATDFQGSGYRNIKREYATKLVEDGLNFYLF